VSEANDSARKGEQIRLYDLRITGAIIFVNELASIQKYCDLQLACKASKIAIIFLSETKVSLRKILKIARE
jgi:hypothetical protein